MMKRAFFTLSAILMLTSFSSQASAQALRPDLMFCGSVQTGGSDLYLGVGPFNEVSGCTPDADTQALMITRSGSISGNGADWLAYLNAGGVIITEYSRTDDVYNEIYGTAYSQGTRFGNCSDSVMPSLKLNPDSEFWTENSGLTETPAGQDGCGYDLSDIVNGEPEVNAFGGIVGTSYVSLAVRQQGDGTFWLVDIDWQDGEGSYSDESKNLMGVMISGGAYAFGSGFEYVPVPAFSTLGLLALMFTVLFVGFRRFQA